ncbi:hypothetical protein JCM4914_70910 [Streptomyces platensis subsp. malvinus]
MGRVRPASRIAHSHSPRGKDRRSGTPQRKSASRHGGSGRGGGGGDGGGGADPGHEVALGLELGVAVLHQTAGQPGLAGELTGGGQPFPDLEPAGADGVP